MATKRATEKGYAPEKTDHRRLLAHKREKGAKGGPPFGLIAEWPD